MLTLFALKACNIAMYLNVFNKRNMKKGLIVLIIALVAQVGLIAQDNEEAIVVKGTIFEMVNNEKVALPFANVFIEGTDIVTTTDFDGNFTLESTTDLKNLKCTFRGYEAFVKEIDGSVTKTIELEILMKTEGTAMLNEQIVSKI